MKVLPVNFPRLKLGACHCDPRQEFRRIIPRDVRAVDFRPPEHGNATFGQVPRGVEIRVDREPASLARELGAVSTALGNVPAPRAALARVLRVHEQHHLARLERFTHDKPLELVIRPVRELLAGLLADLLLLLAVRLSFTLQNIFKVREKGENRNLTFPPTTEVVSLHANLL